MSANKQFKHTETIYRLAVSSVAAVLTAGFLGVSVPAMAQNQAGNNPDNSEALDTEFRPDDAQVRVALIGAFHDDPGVTADDINVQVENNIATLTGTVDSILEKDRAERLVLSVEGVRSVVNRLEIKATTMSDLSIERHVENALATDPVTESWTIDVGVDEGDVYLEGTVASAAEKRIVEKITKGVRGVREVTNDIMIEYEEARPDPEIEQEVDAVLTYDVLIDADNIEVSVENNVATLSGTVPTAAEKKRAISTAYVANLDRVVAEDLKVAERGMLPKESETSEHTEMSAMEVQKAVEMAMFHDPRVSSFNITPDVDEGVVTLTGMVDNVKAKRVAAMNARNTEGVWRVKNNINVRPDERSDLQVLTSVRNAIERDPYLDDDEVGVRVNDGKVILSGDVSSYYDKAQADDAAAKVKGVASVENNLRVASDTDALTYDPLVDDAWYPYDYSWYTASSIQSTFKPDWEIEQDIEEQLQWSVLVDANDIDVEVDNGTATLSGDVENWTEWNAAREKAFNAGAIAVTNDVEVAYGPEQLSPTQ